MLDSALRPLKDRLLTPLVRVIGGAVHPNLLTLAGAGLGAACVTMLYQGRYAAGTLFWLANRVVDGLDGAVARSQGRQTDLGGYLDILLDFALYALVPIAMALGRPDPQVMRALAALLASFYLNAASWMYLAALLEKRGWGAEGRGERTSVVMPAGLVEGTETVVLFTLFMVFPALLAQWFWLTTGLVCLTVAQRLAWAVRRL